MIGESIGLKAVVTLAVIIFVSSLSMSSATVSNSDKAKKIDLVWAESDGLRHELYFTAQRNGNWIAPQKITDDNADNLHPCLDSGADGKIWLFWTAIEQGESEIHYTTNDNGEWLEPQVLPTELSSNIAPTVIVDDGGVPWVVWSANDGISNDEIYSTRFLDGKWQRPKQVNKSNEVPDVLPVISVDEIGTLMVNWEGYRSGKYVMLQSFWTGNGWGPEQIVGPESQKTMVQGLSIEKQIDYPDFIKDTRQAFFRIFQDE